MMEQTSKRILGVMLAAMMTVGVAPMNKGITENVISVLSACAEDEEVVVDGDFEFEHFRTGASITKYIPKEETDIIIVPEKINGERVIRIGEGVFKGSTASSIILPDTVEYIEDNAFENTKNLRTFTFPSGLRYIWNEAFKGSGLESVTLPESIEGYGKSAFENCQKLKEVSFPKKVSCTDNEDSFKDMFSGCTSLSKVTFPENIKYISAGMFYNCYSLRNIAIPDKVEGIAYRAFALFLTKKEEASLNDDYGLSSIEIPASVEYIEGAFFGQKNLSEVKLNEGLEIIYDGAFSGCPIKEIEFPNSIKGVDGFANTLLESVMIPDGTEYIGSFKNCKRLKEVKIPNSVVELPRDAFAGCTSLKSVVLPESVESLWGTTFMDASALTDVTIYNSNLAFYDSEGEFTLDDPDYFSVNCKIPENLTIHGHKFSTAAIYAKNVGIKFEELDDEHGNNGYGRITIVKKPDILKYLKDEELDFSGALVSAWGTNADGETFEYTNVPLDSEHFIIDSSDFDNSKDYGDRCKIIVSPKELPGIKTSFLVDIVSQKEVYRGNISITRLPDKLEYNIGEELDLTGGYAEARGFSEVYGEVVSMWDIADPSQPLDSSYFIVDSSEFDNSKAGTYTIYVSPKIIPRTKASFTVTVVDSSAASLDNVLYGDANCDNKVTVADSVAILQSISNKDKYSLSPQGAVNADCYAPGDGVTANDAFVIQCLDAKQVTELPVYPHIKEKI